ncbi:hypothetical protein RHMOL_Rhmol03G0201300 [Rhododendron molle]|uniref:Uncharacterized protein n=1 Tax=Rhododendron molle TaxID=49168 RepID=A0ACC0PHQ8_RHOML|nr:hypothetical protein RHMOL_Rhmol03G0201300 [Rhododendron molle]
MQRENKLLNLKFLTTGPTPSGLMCFSTSGNLLYINPCRSVIGHALIYPRWKKSWLRLLLEMEESEIDWVRGRDDGGWIPVIRQHRASLRNRIRYGEIFTLYVDNILEGKDQQWLLSTFNKFRVVKDAFISWRRRKGTGSKFGFIRYDCHVSTGMAVSRMNRVWVENNQLFVKEACFGHKTGRKVLTVPRFRVRSSHELEAGEGFKERLSQGWIGRGLGVSYAQILKGETSNLKKAEQSITLRVNPEGNGWLFRSAVAVLTRVISMRTLEVSFSLETGMLAQFRALGGHSVIITFQSQAERDGFLEGLWMKRWISKVKPWRNEPTRLERFMWLSYQGMPLNAWNGKRMEGRKLLQRGVGIREDEEEEERGEDDVLQSTKVAIANGKEVVVKTYG